MATLPAKRARFVEEYLIDSNGTQAAIRAGYSPKTAQMQASQLLTYPGVADAVAAGRARLAEQSTVKAEDVIRELAKLGFANMEHYTRVNGLGDMVIDLSDLTSDQMAAISEITVETYTDGKGEDAETVKRTKFKLADKRAALVDLGKHLGLFTDKQSIKLEGNMSHDWTVKVIAPPKGIEDA